MNNFKDWLKIEAFINIIKHKIFLVSFCFTILEILILVILICRKEGWFFVIYLPLLFSLLGSTYFFYESLLIAIILLKSSKEKLSEIQKNNNISNDCTIIFPIRNEPLNIIKETINSFLEIDSSNKLNIIVIDNSDNNEEVQLFLQDNKYKESVRYVYRKPLESEVNGKAANINIALKLVKTNIIMLADADTRVPPDIYIKVLPFFEDETIGIVQCQRVDSCVNINRTSIQKIRHLLRDKIYESKIAPIKFRSSFLNCCGHNVFLNINAIRISGNLDTNMVIEDSDLAIRIAQAGFKIKFLKLSTEDGLIIGETNWRKRSCRLAYGKTQLFKKICSDYIFTSISFNSKIGTLFHFGRFFFFFYALVTLILYLIFINYLSLDAYLLNIASFHFLIMLPSPLISGFNLLLSFLFFQSLKKENYSIINSFSFYLLTFRKLLIMNFFILLSVIKALIGFRINIYWTQR